MYSKYRIIIIKIIIIIIIIIPDMFFIIKPFTLNLVIALQKFVSLVIAMPANKMEYYSESLMKTCHFPAWICNKTEDSLSPGTITLWQLQPIPCDKKNRSRKQKIAPLFQFFSSPIVMQMFFIFIYHCSLSVKNLGDTGPSGASDKKSSGPDEKSLVQIFKFKYFQYLICNVIVWKN